MGPLRDQIFSLYFLIRFHFMTLRGGNKTISKVSFLDRKYILLGFYSLGFLMFFKGDRDFGGAALEYLIVSVFASALGFGLMILASRLLKERVTETLSKLGVESFEEDLGFFDVEE